MLDEKDISKDVLLKPEPAGIIKNKEPTSDIDDALDLEDMDEYSILKNKVLDLEMLHTLKIFSRDIELDF